jgi:predicted DsbA family dithiol-disulfide isomerase
MATRLTIDFFHDVVCCWCFNISSRMRSLARELDLDIRHRSFVLQASRAEMAARWGTPARPGRPFSAIGRSAARSVTGPI